jgi:hypothetical protein
MTPLVFTVTNAGLALLNRAQLGQAVDLTVAKVALSSRNFVVAPTLTDLPDEVRRLDTVTGADVGDNVTHMVVRDNDAIGYDVRGVGIILANGTLFAAYAQPALLVQKSPAASLNLVIDIAMSNVVSAALTFGNANFLYPPATTDTKGVVELATDAEADAGTPGPLAITARQLKRAIDAVLDMVSEALEGFSRRTIFGAGLVSGGGDLTANRTLTVTAATGAETRAGTRLDLAVTPAGLAAAGADYVVAQDLGSPGYRVFASGHKECWGSTYLPAGSTVNVPLPTAHDTYCIPAGTCSIEQDEASIGALNASAAGFDLRNRNPKATTFYWHTKGR